MMRRAFALLALSALVPVGASAIAQTVVRPPRGQVPLSAVPLSLTAFHDNSSQAAVVGMPKLWAIVPNMSVRPLASMIIFNAAIVDQSANGTPPVTLDTGSWIKFNVVGLPAGQYHVRLDGAPDAGTSVSIRLGQLQSDPVIASCALSGSKPGCDAVVSAPGGASGVVWLNVKLDSGRMLLYDIYIAPTVVTLPAGASTALH